MNTQTREICFAAVKQNGVALQYVGPAIPVPEMTLTAVEEVPDGVALQYVGPPIPVPEMTRTAVEYFIKRNKKTDSG